MSYSLTAFLGIIVKEIDKEVARHANPPETPGVTPGDDSPEAKAAKTNARYAAKAELIAAAHTEVKERYPRRYEEWAKNGGFWATFAPGAFNVPKQPAKGLDGERLNVNGCIRTEFLDENRTIYVPVIPMV